ncbi:MAG TPA: restriction endonuclease subunit S [Spirochaetota bacterium]|nr:restriction endonuclease subunit S [Spirochaetota bacterium]
MDSLLLHAIEKNYKAADALYLQIKEFKKFRMKQFLEFALPEKDIPEGAITSRWPVMSLGNVVDKNAGIMDGPRSSDYYRSHIRETGIPVFSGECIEKLRFMPKQFQYVGTEFREQYVRQIMRGGDILLIAEGTFAGSCAIVPIFHEEGILGERCIRIRPDTGICESFYLLNILHFYHHIGFMETAMDKASDIITPETLQSLPVPVPPLEQQGEITSLMLELSGGMVAQEAYTAELLKLKSLTSLQP